MQANSSMIEKNLQRILEQQEQFYDSRRTKERSIFGQIVNERQRRRDNDISDEEEAQMVVIDEDYDNFLDNAREHRPSYFNSAIIRPPEITSQNSCDQTVDWNQIDEDDEELPTFGGNIFKQIIQQKDFEEVVKSQQKDEKIQQKEVEVKLEDKTNNIIEEGEEMEFQIEVQVEEDDTEGFMLFNRDALQNLSESTFDRLEKGDLTESIIINNYSKFRKPAPIFTQSIKEDELDRDSDSSQSGLSDASYNSKDYQDQIIKLEKKPNKISKQAGLGEKFQESLLKPNYVIQIEDTLDIVTITEETFLKYAERKLQESKAMTMQTAQNLTAQAKRSQLVVQRVLKGPKIMNQTTQSFQKRLSEGIRPTCISVSEFSVIVGTNSGIVFIYDRDNEKFHSLYRDEGKEFKNNAVTCVDVHPYRPEYLVVGHQLGQLVLLDLTKLPQSQKNIKLIKDHHKTSVVSVKFADFQKERPHKEDKQIWMLISCDTQGKVVVAKIEQVALFTLVDTLVIYDPSKIQYQTIATRFLDFTNAKDDFTDNITLIALGSTEDVVIEIIEKEGSQRVFRVVRPKFYPSENQKQIANMPQTLPCIAWGQGRTPNFKDQIYTLLAIAWGPLIQIVVMKNVKSNINESFIMDGYYFIATATEYKSSLDSQFSIDPVIQSMNFIDESLLAVTLSTQDIRVLYIKQFYEKAYEQPKSDTPMITFSLFDTRRKIVAVGTPLTKEQQAIELERRTVLESPVCKSLFGSNCSQTIAISYGRIIILSQDGSIYKLQHQYWEESLGKLETMLINGNSWIEIFTKSLEIFLGKIKGLRGVPDDDFIRSHILRAQLKIKVSEIMNDLIIFWRKKASTQLKQSKNRDTISNDLNRNIQTLMRIIIELTVEISEADFLFTEVYQKFKDVGCSNLFANEIKPYILSGIFQDWLAPEQVINFNILQHHQTIFLEAYHGQNTSQHSPTSGIQDSRFVSSVESFEKVLISLRFDNCSQMNISEMIDFCRKYRLATGVMHLCVNTMEERGPVQALKYLKDFYTEALQEEEMRKRKFTLEDVKALVNIPANQPERIPLERSATYIGLKLLWATKLFIEGRKFPKGHFIKSVWASICNQVISLIIQAEFIQTMCNIDALAYFQILFIVFNPMTQQHFFLQEENVVEQLFLNLQSYCMMQEPNSSIRINFLCLIANISQSQLLKQYDRLFFYTITLQLLEHSQDLMLFNQRNLKSLLVKQSVKVKQTIPEHKAHVLSEEQLNQLMKKSERLSTDNINELVQKLEQTKFQELKINMYEKQEDYYKCLQMQLLQDKLDEEYDCFTWIIKVFCMLQSRIKSSDSNKNFQDFQYAVLNSIEQLVKLDSHKSVGLCDAIFKGDHFMFIQKLIEVPQSQHEYIKKLFDLKGNYIRQIIKAYIKDKQLDMEQQAKQWTSILSLHMRLTSKFERSQVLELVKTITKDSICYPLEECLQICKSIEHLEASSLLSEEIGNYPESIKLLLLHLQKELDLKQLRKELYFYSKHNSKQKLKNLLLLEQVLNKILQLQRQHPEQVLLATDQCWQQVIETISSLLLNKSIKKKKFCKRYLFEILQIQCRQLLGYVTLQHILDSYLKIHPNIKYLQLHSIITEVFLDTSRQLKMNETAQQLVQIECKQLEESFINYGSQGLKFRSLKCALCQQKLLFQKDVEIVFFECHRNFYNHSFHKNCLERKFTQEQSKEKKALKLRCPVCFQSNHDITMTKEDKKGQFDPKQKVIKSYEGQLNQSRRTFSLTTYDRNRKAQLLSEMKEIERNKKMKQFEEKLKDQNLTKSDYKLQTIFDI